MPTIILPVIVIRRLECVLRAGRAAERAEVLAKRPKLTVKDLAKPASPPLSNKTEVTHWFGVSCLPLFCEAAQRPARVNCRPWRRQPLLGRRRARKAAISAARNAAAVVVAVLVRSGFRSLASTAIGPTNLMHCVLSPRWCRTPNVGARCPTRGGSTGSFATCLGERRSSYRLALSGIPGCGIPGSRRNRGNAIV